MEGEGEYGTVGVEIIKNKKKRRCLKMAKRAIRGSAFSYPVFGRTQTRVQQNAALKLSFDGEWIEN